MVATCLHGLRQGNHKGPPAVLRNLDATAINSLKGNGGFLQLGSLAAVSGAIGHNSVFEADTRRSQNRLARSGDILAGVGGLAHSKGQHRRIERGVHEERYGGIFKEPSSFSVHARTSGSGAVRTVACPILISFMVKPSFRNFILYSAAVKTCILTDTDNCPAASLLVMLQRKWKFQILYELCIKDPIRFGELQKNCRHHQYHADFISTGVGERRVGVQNTVQRNSVLCGIVSNENGTGLTPHFL